MKLGRAIFVLWLALIAGCTPAPPAPTAGPAAAGAPDEQTVTKGPVTLVQRLDRTEALVGDPVTLAFELTAELDVDVDLPAEWADPEPFVVRDVRTSPAVPVPGGRQWGVTVVLDTFSAGVHELEPYEFAFVDRRGDDAPIEGTIRSEACAIEVTSVVADAEAEPEGVADFVGIPIARVIRWLLILAGVGVVLILIVLFLLRRRLAAMLFGRPPPAPRVPVTPAHLWASRALDALAADNLLEKGETQTFYFRLSAIVREYVERRFGLMAPERTTEEFLREMTADGRLVPAHQALLGKFLQASDMVKFAKFTPDVAEGDAALDAARAFVHETQPGAVDAPVSLAGAST